jgi:NhaC family Na+:H+ antiporter
VTPREPGVRVREPAAPRAPLTLAAALLPIGVMIALFAAGSLAYGSSQELLIAVLLVSAAVAGAVAARHGAGWIDIQRTTGRKIADVLPALLILLSIGVLIATWVLSGTIPYLVYWGVRLVSPALLVPTAFLATACMSLFTGTSWGSAGTIGVALVSTAGALGAPVAMTAGAVVSGAYFGDKISPLSDTTNISAIAADVSLYRHIRHLLYTTLPSFVVALGVYLLAMQLSPGTLAGNADAGAVLTDIERVYALSPIVLLPLAVVVGCIVARVPAALAILTSAVVAILIGVTLQPFTLQDGVLAVVGGFRADMIAGVPADALSADFRRLAERGGLYAMAATLIVVIAAFLLAAAMEVAGALDLLIGRLLAMVRSTFGLIAATMAAGATMIAVTSHQGVTALVIGGLFRSAYDERDLAPENLSRALEDSVTITEPLMPWTVSGVFMATTLGVSTVRYAPWAVFCDAGPVFSLLIAALYRRTGFGIRQR